MLCSLCLVLKAQGAAPSLYVHLVPCPSVPRPAQSYLGQDMTFVRGVESLFQSIAKGAGSQEQHEASPRDRESVEIALMAEGRVREEPTRLV